MKREILNCKSLGRPCCPGHDKFPSDTYVSNRSKRARAKHIKTEHQVVRAVAKRAIRKKLRELENI